MARLLIMGEEHDCKKYNELHDIINITPIPINSLDLMEKAMFAFGYRWMGLCQRCGDRVWAVHYEEYLKKIE